MAEQWFDCFGCHKVLPLDDSTDPKCSSCGSHNGDVLSPGRFKEGSKAGVSYNIDPRTGKRAKKKKR
jgi:hypothetical protein